MKQETGFYITLALYSVLIICYFYLLIKGYKKSKKQKITYPGTEVPYSAKAYNILIVLLIGISVSFQIIIEEITEIISPFALELIRYSVFLKVERCIDYVLFGLSLCILFNSKINTEYSDKAICKEPHLLCIFIQIIDMLSALIYIALLYWCF